MTPATCPTMHIRRQADSYTPPMLARRYGVSPDKIATWIRTGELRAVNIATTATGRPRWIVTAEALAEFEARRSSAPQAHGKPARRKRQLVGVTEYFS